jgi:hypothetical protein
MIVVAMIRVIYIEVVLARWILDVGHKAARRLRGQYTTAWSVQMTARGCSMHRGFRDTQWQASTQVMPGGTRPIDGAPHPTQEAALAGCPSVRRSRRDVTWRQPRDPRSRRCWRMVSSGVSSPRSRALPSCWGRDRRGLGVRDCARGREVDKKGAVVAGQWHHQAGVAGGRRDLGRDGIATGSERAGRQAPVAARVGHRLA